MAEERPEKVQTSSDEDTAEDDDLLGNLESLLEEEGAGLDQEEALKEDELADLFEDVGQEESAPAEPSAPSPAPGRPRRGDGRTSREERRSRDLEAYKNLDAQIKLTPIGIQVSEDKLVATISRITAENTFEEIIGLLKKSKIAHGIDEERIREALGRARSGQTQYEVEVAHGTPPTILKEAEIVHDIPEELNLKQGSKLTLFERLKHALDGSHVDAVKSWKGPVRIVRKGDVISEVSPAEVQPGQDVFGEEIVLEEVEEIELKTGENVSVSEDGTRGVAGVYGYAGLVEGLPTVLLPIWMSQDHMEARFVYFPPPEPPPPPTAEDLQEILELKWIESGILEHQLDLIQKRLQKKQPLPVTLPIAQGAPEITGEHAQIQYAFDPYTLLNWNQLQTLWSLTSPEDIEGTLKNLLEENEENSEIQFAAFRPGDTVVEKVPATEGIVGRDVQGEEIVPEEGEDIPLEAGDHLTITADELRCVADCFGYACLRFDVQVSVLFPLWITPDKTAAYFVNLPQSTLSKYPSLEDMQGMVDQAGIQYGFSAERWVEILAELEAGERKDYLICIAEGDHSQLGQDAEFEWAVEIEDRQPGKVLDDGSIDYRERSLTTVVKEGDLLGRLLPPQPGISGKDIYGNQLRPPQPTNIEVITDSRIYAEAGDDGMLAFFSEVGGGISTRQELKKIKNRMHRRINIGVYPISNIEGDIDYTTGNIDFNGDVVIGGSVQPLFSVKATGSVTIGGYVEAGAYITAGTDIMIKRGVVGANTELVAGGDVMAKYIQEATVRANGDVKVGSYIFNASIRTRGQVIVPGKGEGKSRALVGGLIWGGTGIAARSIGSPYNTGTRLVSGVDPEQVNRIEQISSNMQSCQEKQQKLLDGIGVPSMDVELIKQKLARCRSPKDKQSILLAVKRIAKVAELEQNLQNELEEIAKLQQQMSFKAAINVTNDFFAGVELRLGEETLLVQEDKQKVRFRLVKEEEELKIQEEPVKGNLKF